MINPHYDDAARVLVEVVLDQLGPDALKGSVVVREAFGPLAFAYNGTLPADLHDKVSAALRAALGAYGRPDRVLIARDDPGADRIFAADVKQVLTLCGDPVRYLDRRLVGADWLTHPASFVRMPPRFVFGSIKGGVGRTTALCLSAGVLAERGLNVLVLDLDLEAPGAGWVLVSDGDRPRFGALDFLAEACVSPNLADLVSEMVAPSKIATSVGGRIDVVPVVGTSSEPVHYLGKLSRAMLDIGPDGAELPLHTKVQQLVEAMTARSTYDVVLIDSRAGLAESTAAPMLRLGATLVFFGTAQAQTIEGYRLLFAHLASLDPPSGADVARRMLMVQAKATADHLQNTWFREQLHALFQEFFYEEMEGLDTEAFNYDVDDPEGPHLPVPIAMNPAFADWDPSRFPEHFAASFYQTAFGPLFSAINARLDLLK